MSENITIGKSGKTAHQGAGATEGGGQFVTPPMFEQPEGVSLARHLSEEVVGTRVFTPNPFTGGSLTYDRGEHVHALLAVSEASVAKGLSDAIIDTHPEFAASISSLRYFDDSASIAVTLPSSESAPERLVIVDVPEGTVTVHTAATVGDRIDDPEWCIENMSGPDSAEGVAESLADIIDRGNWSDSNLNDLEMQNDFVFKVMGPLRSVPFMGPERDTAAARIVTMERSPKVAFAGGELSAAKADTVALISYGELLSEAADLATTPHGTVDHKEGEALGYATVIAAIHAADDSPSPTEFFSARDSIARRIMDGRDVRSFSDEVTADRVENATALMLKSLQWEIHTKTPDAARYVAAVRVLKTLNSVGENGELVGGRAPRGAISRMIVGKPLSSDRMLDHNLSDIDLVDFTHHPRLRPTLGLWH